MRLEAEYAMMQGEQGKNGEDAVLLCIDSSNGNMFKNSDISTTLTVSIIVGGVIIGSSVKLKEIFGENAVLLWRCKEIGETEFKTIPANDERISDEGFIFTLNPKDVDTKAVFKCDLDY